MNQADYIPFGLEWEKEMMKLNKKTLIDFFRKVKRENDELKKWNSIKDKVPEESGLVLILVDEDAQYIAFYKKSHNSFTAYGVRSQEITDFNTTHWKKLPEIPLCPHFNVGSRCLECNLPL